MKCDVKEGHLNVLNETEAEKKAHKVLVTYTLEALK